MKQKRIKNIETYLFPMLIFFLFESLVFSKGNDSVIIDSNMSFEEAVRGSDAPGELIEKLELLTVEYYSLDGKLHRGQMVVHKDISKDVKDVFKLIKETKFPVKKAVPIVQYEWSDNASMEDNNSSAFNYRFIAGTKRLSNHAFGKAVDINPMQNPVIYSSGKISPGGAGYDKNRPGTFFENSPIVKKFKELGWRWGGNFNSFKDYHHFDKE